MPSDNEPTDHAGRLEVIHQPKDSPNIDIIIVHGMGRDSREPWVTDTTNEKERNAVFQDLYVQINARVMVFNSKVDDGVDSLLANSLTRISEVLLRALSLKRSEDEKSQRTPIAFITRDLDGAIVKKALVMAESDAAYFSISQDCTWLIFIDMIHRAAPSTGWDNLLSKMIFSSSLLPSQTKNLASQLRQLSAFFEDLSANFISLHARRCIINVYQRSDDEVEDEDYQAINYYSVTTGLVHEINIPMETKGKDIFKLLDDDHAISTIATCLKAEIKPEYRACLSRLYRISPMFTLPDDQCDLCISNPGVEVQITYDAWCETPLPGIITTGGPQGVGKSLNARTLFWRLKKSSTLVAYFSFTETDASRCSFVTFLGSVIFQVLNQNPERYSRVEDLLKTMHLSDAWTEAGLLVLFYSILDTENGLNPLYLIVDDLQTCDAASKLIEALAEAVSNRSSLTKLKGALFYNTQKDKSPFIEEALQKLDHIRMRGPVLTVDMLKPLAAILANQIISKWPHLFQLRQSLIAALEKCKHTTETLLMIQALSVNDPKLNPRTPKAMNSIISSPQTPVSEAVFYTFNSLPNWGRTALGWIVYSKRPLKLNELATALTLTNERAEFSSTFDTDGMHVDFGSDIEFLFGPLVRFEGGGIIFSNTAVRSQFVELIEGDRMPMSATESLLKAIIPGDTEITAILLRYLSWTKFTTPVEEALRLEKFIQPLGELFHLTSYAVCFLPIHYRACMNSSKRLEPVQDRQLVMWSKLNSKLNSIDSPLYLCTADPDPLLLASHLGFTRVIKTNGKNIKHGDRSVAVSLASWGGHLDTVTELLVGECAVSEEPTEVEEALKYASARGHDDIVDFIVKYMKEKMPQRLAALLDQLLCCAASLGYDKQAVSWIGLGANINTALDNITPLQLAVCNGHTPLVHLLLQYEGIDVNSKAGIDLDSPLLLAARKGYELMVQHLLTAGADITCVTRNEGERTPLYLAAEHGHQAIVRRLIADEIQRHSILNRQSSSGTSPLMIACINGHSEIVKILLDANASVTLQNHDDKTVVYHALRLQDEDLVIAILEHADSVDKFKDIGSVFLRATELGFESVIRHCLGPTTQENKTSLMEYHDQEKEEGKKALHYAAENGHIRIVELLLSLGAEKDPAYQNGQTPLALAAQNGEAEIVRLLLSNGAKADAEMSSGLSQLIRDAEDSTRHAEVIRALLEDTNIDPNSTSEKYPHAALHWAAQLSKIEMTKALLGNHKVEPNVTGECRRNALHYMATGVQTSTEIAELLIEAGTNPLASDNNGWLAIHLASKAGNIPLLELLLNLNPETVQAKTDDGRSVLHFGIESAECVECLLNHKADGNIRNGSGRTPLMVAATLGLDETVKVLLRFGCNAELAIRGGRTALHFAAESGHIGVGRQLLQKHREILSLKDAADLSAIHYAILNCEEAFAGMLLDDFYSKDNTLLGDLCAVMTEKGETPLIVAIKTDQTKIVCRLLKLGVDTEHRDKEGLTALLAAVERPADSSLEMICALLDANLPNHADVNSGGGVHPTALYNAAKYGKMEVVEKLIELGAQVNVQGGQYNTALSAAAVSGFTEIAQFLLDLKKDKADPNLPAGDFANTLCAVLYFHPACDDLVTPLLNAGVKVSARDRQGRSAFHIAARRGSWDTLKQLLSADPIDVSPVDNQGRTLLHHVAMSGKLRPFLYVFKGEQAGRQGTVDWHGGMIKDNDGWTPLHWACRHKDNLDIVRAFGLLFGADLAEATNDKWTPENIAITHNVSNIATFIRQRQLDTESPESGSDPEGKTKSRHSRWKIGQKHWGIVCDGCFFAPIIGVRWKCKNCVDFNFCFKCYWTAKTTHDPNHSFRALPEGEGSGREPECEDDGDDE